MSGDLAAFYAARLDEKEARAGYVHDDMRDKRPLGGTGRCVCGVPGRMLREVAAGRAILDEHRPGYPATFPKPSGQPTCGVCHAGGWDWEPEQWPCPTVRHLAAVWSDHPDCRPEWKP